jgi:hypothetical protein
LPAILDNAAGTCPDGKNAALQCVWQHPLLTQKRLAGLSGAALYQIDAAEGAAVIGQLKPQ